MVAQHGNINWSRKCSEGKFRFGCVCPTQALLTGRIPDTNQSRLVAPAAGGSYRPACLPAWMIGLENSPCVFFESLSVPGGLSQILELPHLYDFPNHAWLLEGQSWGCSELADERDQHNVCCHWSPVKASRPSDRSPRNISLEELKTTKHTRNQCPVIR